MAALFEKNPPALLIHCGGICDVAKCEAHPDWAYDVNVRGTQHILRHLPRTIRLVYCSSDHVFGGRPAPYYELDTPDPVSAYGRTRVQAEEMVLTQRPDALVIRSSLAIGPSIDGKSGHLDWLRYRSHAGLPITVVSDEVRSAVHAEDLAERIWAFADTDVAGVRHIIATHDVARDELAESLKVSYGIEARLDTEQGADRPTPHLGHVALATRYNGRLAAPLPSPLEMTPQTVYASRMKIPGRTVTPFEQRVYDATRQIPKGKVSTYKALAHAIGCASSQAVGQALKRNPFAPRVPCHRIIRSDLTLGGFAGHVDGAEIHRKRSLLQQEGVTFSEARLADRSRLYRF